MTITVQAPDGKVIGFPDGTDNDTISKVMGDYHSGAVKPQDEPNAFSDDDLPFSRKDIGKGPPNATADAIAKFALTAAAGAGGNLANLFWNGPGGMLGASLDPEYGKAVDQTGNMPGNSFERAFHKDVPEYKPDTAAGRVGLAATEGALTGAPFGLAGALWGALSGTTGQGASELTDGNPIVSTLASVGPGFLERPGRALVNRVRATPESTAAGYVAKRLGQDAPEKSLADVQGDLTDTTPPWYTSTPLTLADVGGSNVQGEADRVANVPGQSKAIAKTFLKARKDTLTPDLDTDVGTALGDSASTLDLQNKVRVQQKAAGPVYQEAFSHPGNQDIQSPTLDRIMQTPAGQMALAYARRRMQNRMEPMAEADPELTDQARDTGQVPARQPNSPTPNGVSKGLSLQSWQLVKESFDALWRASKNPNAPPELSSQSFELNQLRRRLVAELDKNDATAVFDDKGNVVTPGKYAQARSMFSSGASALDAIESGSKVFSGGNGAHPAQIAQDMGELDAGDAQLYRTAAANKLRDLISQKGGGPIANWLTRDDQTWRRRQLAPLFAGDPGGLADFLTSADRKATAMQTFNRALSGSRTAPLAAEMAGGHDDGGIGKAAQFVTGALATAGHEPWFGIPLMARSGGRAVRDWWNNKTLSPETNAEIAKLLFSTDPEVQRRVIEAARNPKTNSYTPQAVLPGFLTPRISP